MAGTYVWVWAWLNYKPLRTIRYTSGYPFDRPLDLNGIGINLHDEDVRRRPMPGCYACLDGHIGLYVVS